MVAYEKSKYGSAKHLWRILLVNMVVGLPLQTVTACVTVNSISVNQIPVEHDRKNVVTASASCPVILLFPISTGYIDDAQASLLQSCPYGRIEGMISKQQSVSYFPIILSVEEVHFEGYCVADKGRPRKKRI